jgi:tetratricopeptide (TPR) repeat protein
VSGLGWAGRGRPSRRPLLIALGPVLGAAIGAITNVLTNHWNWPLLGALAALVSISVILALSVDDSIRKRRLQRSAGLRRHSRRAPSIISLPDAIDVIGRKSEITTMLNAVDKTPATGKHIRLLSIEGIGGAGKTSLAVYIAHKVSRHYPDGALFINLRSHVDGKPPLTTSEVLVALLSGLGFREDELPESFEGLVALWRQELSRARVLVVLDDVADTDQIEQIIGGGEQCLFIATSRQRLIGIPGTVSVPVDRLDAPDAATLFATMIGIDPDGEQRADVAELIRRVGGLPIALVLTAGRMRYQPTWAVRDLLSQDVTKRTDLEEVYALSYRDLNPELKSFFQTLSLHPGPDITPEAAAALSACSIRAAYGNMEKLYNRYLLSQPRPGRYKIHDLIRGFLNQEHLEMEEVTVQREPIVRLMKYYAFLAESASRAIGMHDQFDVAIPTEPNFPAPADEVAALAWFEAELANLFSCATYSASESLMPYSWQIPASMTYYLRLTGRVRQGEMLLDSALRSIDGHADALAEAIVLRRLGQLSRLRTDYPLSRSRLNRSLQLSESLNNRQSVAWSYHELGHLDWASGDLSRGREEFLQALSINKSLGNVDGLAAAELNLGALLGVTGEIDAARGYLQDVLRIYTDSGSRRGIATVLYRLGQVERYDENFQEARRMLGEALEIYSSLGNRQGQAECLLNLGVVDRATGSYEQATQQLERAITIFRDLEYPRSEADAYTELAATAEAAGDVGRAAMHRKLAQRLHGQLSQDAR